MWLDIQVSSYVVKRVTEFLGLAALGISSALWFTVCVISLPRTCKLYSLEKKLHYAKRDP